MPAKANAKSRREYTLRMAEDAAQAAISREVLGNLRCEIELVIHGVAAEEVADKGPLPAPLSPEKFKGAAEAVVRSLQDMGIDLVRAFMDGNKGPEK